jgi:penicillin-binding protein 1A
MCARVSLGWRVCPVLARCMAWGAARLRRAGYLAAFLVACYGVVWVAVIRNLPSADKLLTYQPPLPTMVRGSDGAIIYSYARERRAIALRGFPKPLVNAFLSAEDKNFFSHGGVDFIWVRQWSITPQSSVRASARGGSTITQQVAKNILIGNEYSVSRKLKEMLLARRIESVLTKQQILELYSTRSRWGVRPSVCRPHRAPISARMWAIWR